MRHIETLIIGQGLAGSTLAWKLLKKGEDLLVIDNNHTDSSSMAAAGLVNPIIGKRLVKHPLTEQWLSSALYFYAELEKYFSQKLFHSKAMWRLFQNPAELAAWQKKIVLDEYQGDLGTALPEQALQQFPDSELGGFVLPRTGYLDTTQFLEVIKTLLSKQQRLISSQFNENELSFHKGGVEWRDIRFKKVVFCRGYKDARNHWFDWLPFQPSKGEILTLKTEQQLPDAILNRGKWLIPLGNKKIRFGASYDREHINSDPSEGARQELLKALAGYLKQPINVELLTHRAGVRPGTQDKEPFLGSHPNQSRLYLFNGFGSRGSLTIPYYAELMADLLNNQQTLPNNIDIKRHWKKS